MWKNQPLVNVASSWKPELKILIAKRHWHDGWSQKASTSKEYLWVQFMLRGYLAQKKFCATQPTRKKTERNQLSTNSQGDAWSSDLACAIRISIFSLTMTHGRLDQRWSTLEGCPSRRRGWSGGVSCDPFLVSILWLSSNFWARLTPGSPERHVGRPVRNTLCCWLVPIERWMPPQLQA